MENSDGRVVLTVSTKIDQSVTKTIDALKTKFGTLKGASFDLSALTQGIKDQKHIIKELNIQYAELIALGKGESDQAKQLKIDIINLTNELRNMEGAAETLDNKSSSALGKFSNVLTRLLYLVNIYQIIQFSKASSSLAMQTEASAKRLVAIYGDASKAVGDFIDTTATGLGMSKAAAAEYAATYGNLFSSWADGATNAQLTSKYLQMTAVVASNTGRSIQDVQERVRSGLLGNTESIEDLGIFVNVSTIEMTDAFKRMADGKSWEQLDEFTKQQIRSFAILEQATNKYGDAVMESSTLAKAEFSASYEEFKNTWGEIVNTVLIPAMSVLSSVLQVLTSGLNALKNDSGKILDGIDTAESNTNKIADNIEDQKENLEDLNEEMNKSLAGFDKIQILSRQAADSEEETATQPVVGNQTLDSSNTYSEKTNSIFAPIMALIGGALAAVGAILICYGQVGWGIGFIIAGASLFSVSAAEIRNNVVSEKTKAFLDGIIVVASVALLAIGIVLCATGVALPLGVALIAVGATGLVGEAVINFKAIKKTVTDIIEGVKESALSAYGMLAIGSLLLLVSPLLGLTCIGVALYGLGYQASSPNLGDIKEMITDVFNEAKKIYDDKIKPGLDKVAEAWNALYEEHLKPVFDYIYKEILVPFGEYLRYNFASSFTIAVGILASAGKLLIRVFGDVFGIVTDTLSGVLDFIRYALAGEWESAFESLGYVVVNVFKGIVNIVGDVLQSLIDGINSVIKGVNKLKIPSIGFNGLNIPTIDFKIPKLAQGAVIPANREFLAVLGDQKHGENIEAPASLIKQMVIEALNELGSNNSNTIILEVDGREFGRAVIEQGKRESRRIGTSLKVST